MRQLLPKLTLPRATTFDVWLLVALLMLVSLGLVMVASASISIAASKHDNELYYFVRQIYALGMGTLLGVGLFQTGQERLLRYSGFGLIAAIVLLMAVLIPGLGHRVNGSLRWLRLGYLTLQASEVAKLAVIVYLAGYLVRHREHVQQDLMGFIKPMGVLALIAVLLLMEPDLGTTVVLGFTALMMVWLGGVPLPTFIVSAVIGGCVVGLLIVLEPYRLQRLLTYRDPWAEAQTSGYQLTQALIAFGRGEWFGVGLGNSVQKLFYLPEVHTDFIFAVIGEELGVVGTLFVIFLFLFLVWRIFRIGARAEQAGLLYGANLAYGVALLIGLEAFVNIGVSTGFLPTKGLTLPFISYGSNSTIVLCGAMGIVLRVAWDSATPPSAATPPTQRAAPETTDE